MSKLIQIALLIATFCVGLSVVYVPDSLIAGGVRWRGQSLRSDAHENGSADGMKAIERIRKVVLGSEDISKLVDGSDLERLKATYLQLGAVFWTANPNRIRAFHVFAKTASEKAGTDRTIEEFVPLLVTQNFEVTVSEQYLRILGASVFETSASDADRIAVLSHMDPKFGLSVLIGTEEGAASSPKPSEIYGHLIRSGESLKWELTKSTRHTLCVHAVRIACLSGDVDVPDLCALLQNSDFKGIQDSVFGDALRTIAFLLPGKTAEFLSAALNGDRARMDKLTLLPPKVLKQAILKLAPGERSEVLKGYTKSLLRSSPDKAFQFSQQFAVDELSQEAAGNVVAGLLGGGARDVKSWIGKLKPDEQTKIMEKAMGAHVFPPSPFSPASAQAWFDASAELPGLSANSVSSAVSALGSSESPPSLESLLRAADLVNGKDAKEGVRTVAKMAYFSRLSSADPARLMKEVESESSDQKKLYLHVATDQLAAIRPKEAMKWLATATDEQIKRSLQNSLIGSESSDFSLDQRKEVYLDRIKEIRDPEELRVIRGPLDKLITEYAIWDDPAKAAQMVDVFPESKERDLLAGSLVKQWGLRIQWPHPNGFPKCRRINIVTEPSRNW